MDPIDVDCLWRDGVGEHADRNAQRDPRCAAHGLQWGGNSARPALGVLHQPLRHTDDAQKAVVPAALTLLLKSHSLFSRDTFSASLLVSFINALIWLLNTNPWRPTSFRRSFIYSLLCFIKKEASYCKIPIFITHLQRRLSKMKTFSKRKLQKMTFKYQLSFSICFHIFHSSWFLINQSSLLIYSSCIFLNRFSVTFFGFLILEIIFLLDHGKDTNISTIIFLIKLH